eukprot:Em0014g167a
MMGDATVGPPYDGDATVGPPYDEDATVGPPYDEDATVGPPYDEDATVGPPYDGDATVLHMMGDATVGPPYDEDATVGPPYDGDATVLHMMRDATVGPPYDGDATVGPPYDGDATVLHMMGDATVGPPYDEDATVLHMMRDATVGPPYDEDATVGPPYDGDATVGPPYDEDATVGPPYDEDATAMVVEKALVIHKSKIDSSLQGLQEKLETCFEESCASKAKMAAASATLSRPLPTTPLDSTQYSSPQMRKGSTQTMGGGRRNTGAGYAKLNSLVETEDDLPKKNASKRAMTVKQGKKSPSVSSSSSPPAFRKSSEQRVSLRESVGDRSSIISEDSLKSSSHLHDTYEDVRDMMDPDRLSNASGGQQTTPLPAPPSYPAPRPPSTELDEEDDVHSYEKVTLNPTTGGVTIAETKEWAVLPGAKDHPMYQTGLGKQAPPPAKDSSKPQCKDARLSTGSNGSGGASDGGDGGSGSSAKSPSDIIPPAIPLKKSPELCPPKWTPFLLSLPRWTLFLLLSPPKWTHLPELSPPKMDAIGTQEPKPFSIRPLPSPLPDNSNQDYSFDLLRPENAPPQAVHSSSSLRTLPQPPPDDGNQDYSFDLLGPESAPPQAVHSSSLRPLPQPPPDDGNQVDSLIPPPQATKTTSPMPIKPLPQPPPDDGNQDYTFDALIPLPQISKEGVARIIDTINQFPPDDGNQDYTFDALIPLPQTPKEGVAHIIDTINQFPTDDATPPRGDLALLQRPLPPPPPPPGREINSNIPPDDGNQDYTFDSLIPVPPPAKISAPTQGIPTVIASQKPAHSPPIPPKSKSKGAGPTGTPSRDESGLHSQDSLTTSLDASAKSVTTTMPFAKPPMAAPVSKPVPPPSKTPKSANNISKAGPGLNPSDSNVMRAMMEPPPISSSLGGMPHIPPPARSEPPEVRASPTVAPFATSPRKPVPVPQQGGGIPYPSPPVVPEARSTTATPTRAPPVQLKGNNMHSILAEYSLLGHEEEPGGGGTEAGTGSRRGGSEPISIPPSKSSSAPPKPPAQATGASVDSTGDSTPLVRSLPPRPRLEETTVPPRPPLPETAASVDSTGDSTPLVRSLPPRPRLEETTVPPRPPVPETAGPVDSEVLWPTPIPPGTALGLIICVLICEMAATASLLGAIEQVGSRPLDSNEHQMAIRWWLGKTPQLTLVAFLSHPDVLCKLRKHNPNGSEPGCPSRGVNLARDTLRSSDQNTVEWETDQFGTKVQAHNEANTMSFF